jgi:mRNA interferase RelE/StbE
LDKTTQARLGRRIESLADNPRPQGVKKLAGEDDFYRVRVGDYRIVYQIRDKSLLVLIVRLGHRSEVYRGI